MRRLHLAPIPALALFAAACLESQTGGGAADRDEPAEDLIREVLAEAGETRIVGRAPPPRPETGHAPRYELFADGAGGDLRELGIEAIDAALDAETNTLAWIDPLGTLYVAPLEDAPAGKRDVAGDALLGLAAQDGSLAFAIRVDGPNTSPYTFDLRRDMLMPLDDGRGPDEIVGFSPSGRSVLLLSGRTGLASLYEAGIDGSEAVQLTNAGLSPGPELDTSKVVPAPMNLQDVVWAQNGIAYRAAEEAIWIRPDGEVAKLARDAAIEEVVR